MKVERDTKPIENLNKHGKSLFGSNIKFNRWLDTANFGLGGKRPAEYLTYNDGIKYIDDLLTRIEHGILV